MPQPRACSQSWIQATLLLPFLLPVLPQMSTPGAGAALVPRLLRSAVGLLDEGGLEARTAGKRMLWMLRDLLDGGGRVGEEFKWALGRLDCKTDKARGGCCGLLRRVVCSGL